MRDVSTCPELSYGCVRPVEDSDGQSKPLSSTTELHTDSAPAVLPTPSSAETTSCQLSSSYSVPGEAHVVYTGASANQLIQCIRDVVNADGNRTDANDRASCQDVMSTGTVMSCRLQPDAVTPVMQPSHHDHVTEATTRQPQTVASSDVEADIVTQDSVTAGACLKCDHDTDVESTDRTRAETSFEYHIATECSDVAMAAVSSSTPVTSNSAADLVGSASKLSACNTTIMDCDSFTSSETDNTESGGHPTFAGLELAVVDECIDMPEASVAEICTQQDSASHPVIVMVDEESSMSVVVDDQLGQLSDADRTMCFSSAVAEYSSNGERHYTLDDMPCVSNLHLSSILSVFHVVCLCV